MCDAVVRKMFSDAEWAEVVSYGGRLKAPSFKIPKAFPEALGDIPAYAASKLLEDDADWLGAVLVNAYSLYKDGHLDMDHGETGICCIWSKLIDVALTDSGCVLRRGELRSMPETRKLNAKRSSPDEKHIYGPRYDGILTGAGGEERGFMEVSKLHQEKFTTKRLVDEQKMSLAMQIGLEEKRNNSDTTTFLSQYMASSFIGEHKIRLFYMTPGKGSTMIVNNIAESQIPKKYNPESFLEFLAFLAMYRDAVMGNIFEEGSLVGIRSRE